MVPIGDEMIDDPDETWAFIIDLLDTSKDNGSLIGAAINLQHWITDGKKPPKITGKESVDKILTLSICRTIRNDEIEGDYVYE